MTMTAIAYNHVTLRHGRTRYIDVGTGPPLILLHISSIEGGADDSLPALGILSSSFRVLAPDLGVAFLLEYPEFNVPRELGWDWWTDRRFVYAAGITEATAGAPRANWRAATAIDTPCASQTRSRSGRHCP